MGKSAADLLTLSEYVRGRLSSAATIVTQLVTHLWLAAEVITCKSTYLPGLTSLTWVNGRP